MRRLNIAAAALAAGLAVTSGAGAAQQTALPVEKYLPVGLALDAVQAAVATCEAQGLAVAVAVVDPSGNPIVLASSRGVSPISVELSQRKARAAALFKVSSGALGERFRAAPAYGQAMNAVDPRISGAQGALPIMAGGVQVGAMGISGAPSGDRDEVCVKAGLDAIAGSLR